MSTLTVTMHVPRDVLGVLDVPPTRLEAQLQELIVLELVRERRISSGNGAEWLGISKLAFIQLLAQRGIPYFTESPEELVAEVTMLGQVLGELVVEERPGGTP
jgi:predicted HTH domain antitoxin